jgi:S-layer homology domain
MPKLSLLLIVISISACSNNIQQALAPDPRLQTSPTSPVPQSTMPESVDSASPLATSSASPVSSAAVPHSSDHKYLAELTELGVLSRPESQQPLSTAVTRRQYARWLITAHNKIYQANPSQQLKLATSETTSVFIDVPVADPDFIAIQSLANAGIIASSLSGNNTAASFQPDLPLTREQLILWKVPLDRRQALPTTTVATVQQKWGFQDAAKITPLVLPAVLADYQNGDNSNIRRSFGYTTLFQPQKPVTFAEIVSTIWYFGNSDGRSAHDAIQASNSSPPT